MNYYITCAEKIVRRFDRSQLGGVWPLRPRGKPTMPRYYFHLLDESTANLVRDSAGASLPNASEARREAIGLPQDIIRHGLHGLSWQVILTDADANVVLRVP